MSINKLVAKGALWMLALKIAIKSIGLVSTIILARLLSPSDFGLIAIIMAFFALIEIFGNFSFDTVLIQKQSTSREQYDTAWSLNFTFGAIACLFVFISAGWVAEFYNDERLRHIMMALGLLFIISGAQNIGIVEFRKNLTFELEFKFQLIPKIVSFFITIFLAYVLKNFWALVIGSLVWKLLILISSYQCHPYRPKLRFSAWRDLFGFSKWLMINNIFYFLNNRSAELIVGKIISPQAAGLFSIAQEISTLPTSELVGNINTATYPGYCKVAHSPEKLKEMYFTTMGMVALLVLPAGFGLASLSEVLVSAVLGAKWVETVALIKILSISGVLIALNTNTGFLFLAMGRPKVTTLMSFLRILVLIPAMIILSPTYGLNGIAMASLLTAVCVFLCFSVLTRLELDSTVKQIAVIYLRPLISSLIMFLCVRFVFSNFNNCCGAVTSLLVLILVGVICYPLSLYLLWLVSGMPDGPERKVWRFFSERLSSTRKR